MQGEEVPSCVIIRPTNPNSKHNAPVLPFRKHIWVGTSEEGIQYCHKTAKHSTTSQKTVSFKPWISTSKQKLNLTYEKFGKTDKSDGFSAH